MGTHHPGLRMDYDDLVRLVMRTAVQTIQNASIGSAGIRVYDGGWIRIEGGGLFIDGLGEVSGELFVKGELGGDGTLTWTGEWKFVGNGEITGDVVISGKLKTTSDVELGGDTTIKKNLDVEAKTRLRGETTLEADLTITDDGQIKVGEMTIDPGGRGRVSFGDGTHIMSSDSGAGVVITTALSNLLITPGAITVQVGTTIFQVGAGGIRATGIPATTDVDSLNWIGIDAGGYLKRVDPAVGGPLGGPFEWPFPLSMVTSEFGPRPEMGDYHTGMDFGPPSGTPVPSAGPGRVVASGWVEGGGGYHIKIDHGIKGGKRLETGYFHLIEAPALQVGAMVATGTIVGNVGSTGNSTGPHLHWETFIDGVQVNPRSFMDQYGKK